VRIGRFSPLAWRYARSTCIHGQYGGAPAPSQQRPQSAIPWRCVTSARKLFDEASLADAGLTDDEKKSSAPALDVVETGA